MATSAILLTLIFREVYFRKVQFRFHSTSKKELITYLETLSGQLLVLQVHFGKEIDEAMQESRCCNSPLPIDRPQVLSLPPSQRCDFFCLSFLLILQFTPQHRAFSFNFFTSSSLSLC